MKINIAIDGPSAAGKSTIAKLCASMLNYSHLDTGAMYRCVGYLSKQLGIDEEDETALVEMIKQMKIDFDSQGHVYINNTDVSQEIRQNDISMRASNVSKLAGVRKTLVALQQEIAKNKGYILDGRDIGTVVLPDAELKVFLVASVEARAKRRILEYQQKGIACDEKEIYEDIKKRDYQDSHRENSPLVCASDAYQLDTSNMNIEEVKQWFIDKLTEMGVYH